MCATLRIGQFPKSVNSGSLMTTAKQLGRISSSLLLQEGDGGSATAAAAAAASGSHYSRARERADI